MKVKKYIKDLLSGLILIFVLNSCQREIDGIVEYKAIPKTAVGTKLVKTDLFATIFSDSTYKVTDGVQATEMHYFSKKGYSMHIFVFEVDLTNPKIDIEVSTPGNSPAYSMQPMTLQATFEDAVGHMVWGGVNGDFFNTTTGAPNGLLYKNATLIKPYSGSYPDFFVITKNKLAVVGDGAAYDTLKTNIQEGLGGGVLLVKNNVNISQTDFSINPRTCLGVSSDYKKVFILVVDGRNYHYSNGMTYEESGKCMVALGAKDAINLDGGGSSTFFIRKLPDFSPGRFVLRNWPSDNGGQERSVANGLLIVAKP